MSKPTSCEARQHGDEMQCGRCGLTWATNDPERPACAPRIDKRAIPTRSTTRAIQRLDGAGPLLERLAHPTPGDVALTNVCKYGTSNPYGCHSRPRPVLGAVAYLAQTGYTEPVQDGAGVWYRTPTYAPVFHVMTTDCGYAREGGAAATDPRCDGCPHAGRV